MFISCQEDLIFMGLHFLRWERSCVIAGYDSVDYGFACGSFIFYKLFCESCLMDLRRAQMHLRGQVSITFLASADRSGESIDAYSKVDMYSDGITL